MAADAAPKKVLIIDDEQDIVDLISEVLARDEYEPIVATVWTEAIDAITSAEPDLMLLDLKMPTIDGSAILEFIRKEGIQLPVIVVSGFLTDDVMATLSNLGVAAFIRKPFKVGQLKAEIERVLGAPGPRESAPAAGPGSPQAEKEVLNAFQKLGGSGTPVERPSERAGAAAAEDPSKEAEILQAFQKLKSPRTEGNAAPPSASEGSRPSPDHVARTFREQQTRPAGAPEARTEGPPRQAPAVVPEAPEPSPAARRAAHESAPDAEVPQESEERRHHRSRHRGRRRSRSATRRNIVYMGLITLVCIFIATFLAVMQWYAAEVDVTQIKKGVTKSVQEQVKEELLKELKEQQK
jgi:DNA-binding response OmpR family regulator